MGARLYEGSIVSGVARWRRAFLGGAMAGRRRLGFVVVGSKGGLPSWRYGSAANSRVLGFAAALDAVSVFFLKLISYRYHILVTSRTRCYYALAKNNEGGRMKRRVIYIDEEKCTGCGLCVHACHEGAIGLVGGKARLLRDDYCDGLGDCLPACPENAIEFIEREAAAYDETAVIAEKMRRAQAETHASMPAGGCPGSMAKTIVREVEPGVVSESGQAAPAHGVNSASNASSSENPFPAPAGGVSTVVNVPARLSNWPAQIKLAPVNAPYFQGCDLLVAADCTAFAYGAFHEDFLKGRVCLIGCPKLDGVDYTEKLAQIIAENNVRSVLVARMQVPCCGGLEQAVRRAVAIAGSQNGAGAGGADITGGAVDAVGAVASSIPVQIDVISSDGRIVAVG